MADFDSVNNNEGLWKLIQDSIFSLSNRFQSILKKEDFQYKFRITENCWQEGDNFINVGEIFLPIPITYLPDRFTSKERQWKKECLKIEEPFKVFFSNFKVPEQYYLGKPNPLLKTIQNPILQMDNLESNILTIEDLGLSIKSDYLNNVKFKLSLNKLDFTTSKPCDIGLNFFEDNTIITLSLKVQIFISNSVQNILSIISSNTLSPVIYLEYLKKQLAAFFGDCQYPEFKINVTSSENFPFDNIENAIYPNSFYLDKEDNIIYIPTVNLSYDSYIKETLTGYDSAKRKVIKPLTEISGIQNKIINIDLPSLSLIYSNELGELCRFPLNELSYLKIDEAFAQDFLSIKASNPRFIDFLKILKQFGCNFSGMNFDKLSIGQVMESFSDKLQDFYKKYDSLDLPILLKMKNRFPLFLEIYKGTFGENEISSSLEFKILNLSNFKIPVKAAPILQTSTRKTILVDSSKLMSLDALFLRYSLLVANSKISNGCIISRNTTYFQKIYGISNSFVILDKETLPELIRLFGSNLLDYLRTLKTKSLLLIDPNVFACSNLLANSKTFIANEQIERNFIIELLSGIDLEFIGVDINDITMDQFYSFAPIFNKGKYIFLCSDKKTKDTVNISKFLQINQIYSLDLKDLISVNSKQIFITSHFLEIPEIQKDVYASVFSNSKNLMEGSEDYLNCLNFSKMTNFSEIEPIINKYLGYSNQFLNTPNSDIFEFAKASETEVELKKIDSLIHYLYCCYFGGIYDNIMIQPKSNIKVIYFSNDLSRKVFEARLEKFFEPKPQENFRSELLIRSNITEYDFIDSPNIDEAIIFDTQINRNFLTNLYLRIQKSFWHIPNCVGTDFKITSFYFRDTLESSVYNLNLQTLSSTILNQFDKPQLDIDDVLSLLDFKGKSNEEISKSEELVNNNLKAIYDYSLEIFQDNQISILKKYGYKISKESLQKVLLKKVEFVEDSSPNTLYPFKNYMHPNSLIPLYLNLPFVSDEGKPVQLKNELKPIIMTEIGYGEIVSSQNGISIVNVFDYKNTPFPSDLIFGYPKDLNENLENLKQVPLFIRPDLLQISEFKVDPNQTLLNEETTSLNYGFINGYPAIYNTKAEVNLARYGFKYFKNVFVIEIKIEDSLNSALNQMQLQNGDKEAIQEIFDQFSKGNKIKIPAQYNYFISGNIPTDFFKVFPTIINDKFFLFINGYFYSKECLKLSRKLPINMIETLFYMIEPSINTLRIQFYKLGKTLDIENLQEGVNFFNEKMPIFKEPDLSKKSQPIQTPVKMEKVNPLFHQMQQIPNKESLQEKSNRLQQIVKQKRGQ